MRGSMELEYIFKMLLYIVVILVVIGIIVGIRPEILDALKLCRYLPSGCEEDKECSNLQVSESIITESTLNKYCKFCWDKTGAKEDARDCMCYVVSGSYSPLTASLPEYCELKCNKEATSIWFSYSSLFKKITIGC
jgi:hypothetical protein